MINEKVEKIDVGQSIVLNKIPAQKFKTNYFEINFVRPLTLKEASQNALLMDVLLRGSKKNHDLKSINARLNENFGATLNSNVRKMGEDQIFGFSSGFIKDQLALEGKKVLKDMLNFIFEVLFDPKIENGRFLKSYVESEKKNLKDRINSKINDKRSYALIR